MVSHPSNFDSSDQFSTETEPTTDRRNFFASSSDSFDFLSDRKKVAVFAKIIPQLFLFFRNFLSLFSRGGSENDDDVGSKTFAEDSDDDDGDSDDDDEDTDLFLSLGTKMSFLSDFISLLARFC